MFELYLIASIFIVIISLPISWGIIFIRAKNKKKDGQKADYVHDIVIALLITYATILAVLTLTPMPVANGGSIRINLIPFVNFFANDLINPIYTYSVYVLNIFMFVPLGFFTTLLQKLKGKLRFRNIFFILMGTTVAIEILQLLLRLNRVTDIDDLITNTVGGIIGYFIARIFVKKLT